MPKNNESQPDRFDQSQQTCPLVDCMTGDRVIISEIDAGRGAAMNLACLGLHIGDVIRLERRSPFRGPLTVVHRGSEIAIGFSLAQKILVTKA